MIRFHIVRDDDIVVVLICVFINLSMLIYLIYVAWLFHLNFESRIAFPYPQHSDMYRESIIVNQQVNSVSNRDFSHFCIRKMQ